MSNKTFRHTPEKKAIDRTLAAGPDHDQIDLIVIGNPQQLLSDVCAFLDASSNIQNPRTSQPLGSDFE